MQEIRRFLTRRSAGGRADYLVTGAEDLLELRGRTELGAPRIVTAREFLESLGAP
jgi:predicted nucleic acid-binding protein